MSTCPEARAVTRANVFPENKGSPEMMLLVTVRLFSERDEVVPCVGGDRDSHGGSQPCVLLGSGRLGHRPSSPADAVSPLQGRTFPQLVPLFGHEMWCNWGNCSPQGTYVPVSLREDSAGILRVSKMAPSTKWISLCNQKTSRCTLTHLLPEL